MLEMTGRKDLPFQLVHSSPSCWSFVHSSAKTAVLEVKLLMEKQQRAAQGRRGRCGCPITSFLLAVCIAGKWGEDGQYVPLPVVPSPERKRPARQWSGDLSRPEACVVILQELIGTYTPLAAGTCLTARGDKSQKTRSPKKIKTKNKKELKTNNDRKKEIAHRPPPKYWQNQPRDRLAEDKGVSTRDEFAVV